MTPKSYTGPIPRRKLFEPDRKSSCLCGSGLRFSNCCKGRLPGFNNNKKWRKAAKQKQWTEAVRHARADVTQYTIWHLSNTAPLIRQKPEFRFARLMEIDVEALSELVENLMWVYARKGWLSRLAIMLDRLETNIDDPRWRAKIAYHRATCALWRDDRDQARREIGPLQPITPQHPDLELLQLHLDIKAARWD